MMSILNNDWTEQLAAEFEKPYYLELFQFLNQEYSNRTIFPEMDDIFNALHYTSYVETKVVILGQDPYHGIGQAHGLSFSVKPGVKAPPSLQNMLKELRSDLGCTIPNNGYLVPWAERGVLLLNTVLTVREGEAASHKGKGWERFTDEIICKLNEREQPVVFILWGSQAHQKMQLITNSRHHILKSVHPSPLSVHRGFYGSKPYSEANAFLHSIGSTEIDWQLPNI
ncbi:uracil-DNA glycosylase [Paenibacillus agricola]|uniref:Uracil-DNA glycosylase n=1 Tax=Paenibacillus agricola TaxID=2716264 RepID=A0ABX0J7X0_9BACL|nr:uracil-DNA glycosylase [Paenibacillus agricola]NHN31264.1 uracil-DNA glycosylase [Paenibacillus agricola]